MKIRTGFVSNSSSSSFIVHQSSGVSNIDIAREMIKCRDFAHDADDLKQLELLKDEITDETALTFSTINYETYIFPGTYRDCSVYFVCTSNNHMFRDLDFLTFIGEDDIPMDELKSKEFHDIELDLHYKAPNYSDDDNFCDKHLEFKVELTRGADAGKTTCPKCQFKKEKSDKELQKKKMNEKALKRIEFKDDFFSVEERESLKELYDEKNANTLNEKIIVMRYEVGEDVCIADIDELTGLEYTYLFNKNIIK
jgi:hypothetical protein